MCLGGMTEAEMLRRMSSRELSRWMALYEVEPFGPQESERQAAMITAMVANTARDEDKKKEPFTEQDFMHGSLPSDPSPSTSSGSGVDEDWIDVEDYEAETDYHEELDKYALARKAGAIFGTPIPGLE